MADRALIPTKVETSRILIDALVSGQSPVAAAYWECREDRDGWVLFIVAHSEKDGFVLVDRTSTLLIEPPYRNVFSLSDVIVDSHQLDRARAIGAYLGKRAEFGARVSTTFTGGYYFEDVIVVYLSPELTGAMIAAS